MHTSVWVALITVVGGLCGAAITYLLAQRQQREADHIARKVMHYQELVAAISDLAVDNSDTEAHHRFARAMNTTILVAPQAVIEALVAFFQGVKVSGHTIEKGEHDRLLVQLLLAIRRDLRVEPADDPVTFKLELVGAPPRSRTGR